MSPARIALVLALVSPTVRTQQATEASAPPAPLFTKLDTERVVEEELARMEGVAQP